MQTHRVIVLCGALLGGLTLPALAQSEASGKKKPDPAVAEKLDRFESAIKQKGERDQEAQNIIDKLIKGYPTMVKKDQSGVRRALQDCLVSERVKREPDQPGLFAGAAAALGGMDADGAKILAKAYKSPKFKGREWVAMRSVFIKNIGKTKDPRHVEFLLERALRDPDDVIMRAAGEALGNFKDSPLKLRKEIAKELIKKFGEVYGKAKASLDPGDAQVKRSMQRLDAIKKYWNETLTALTGQSITSPPDWQRFYNKNKAKNWDKL